MPTDARLTPEEREAIEPPDWACDAFLRTINVEAKMVARMRGEAGAVPRSWSMVDAVIHWWESEGRSRWISEQVPDLTAENVRLLADLRAVEAERDRAVQSLVVAAIPLEVLLASEACDGLIPEIAPSVRTLLHSAVAAIRLTLRDSASRGDDTGGTPEKQS